VLVVLASAQDDAARDFVDGCGVEARLLSCRDLSARGWRYAPHGRPNRAVVGGELVDASDIDGVLTRLPSVTEAELGHIVEADRAYVAAEMTAFLAAWLADAACPVSNRPTPVCLMGPYWTPERWVRTASALGITVVPVHRTTDGPPPEAPVERERPTVTVNVIGQRCLPGDDSALGAASAALAQVAGVDLLRAHFRATDEGPAFAGADYWLDVSDPETAGAVLDVLGHMARARRAAPSSTGPGRGRPLGAPGGWR
jgi:hypothetical protein